MSKMQIDIIWPMDKGKANQSGVNGRRKIDILCPKLGSGRGVSAIKVKNMTAILSMMLIRTWLWTGWCEVSVHYEERCETKDVSQLTSVF